MRRAVSFEVSERSKGNEKIAIRVIWDKEAVILCNLNICEEVCEVYFLIWRKEINVVVLRGVFKEGRGGRRMHFCVVCHFGFLGLSFREEVLVN